MWEKSRLGRGGFFLLCAGCAKHIETQNTPDSYREVGHIGNLSFGEYRHLSSPIFLCFYVVNLCYYDICDKPFLVKFPDERRMSNDRRNRTCFNSSFLWE
jgi:hypothetical protein